MRDIIKSNYIFNCLQHPDKRQLCVFAQRMLFGRELNRVNVKHHRQIAVGLGYSEKSMSKTRTSDKGEKALLITDKAMRSYKISSKND
jgi:hypothetical protein